MAESPLTPSERKRTLWTIWGSFASAILIYGFPIFIRAQPNIESSMSIDS